MNAISILWIVIVLIAACPVSGQEHGVAVEARYVPFQGTWKLIPPPGETVPMGADIPEVYVEVTGSQFALRGKGVKTKLDFPLEFYIPQADEDKPYRQMSRRGWKGFADIVDIESQIRVFWFVGIYKLENDILELRLKYVGQGSEFESYRGEVARNATLPSNFDDEVPESEARIVLERVRKQPRTAADETGPAQIDSPPP